MKKMKPRTIIYGLLGVALSYMAISQYVFNGESMEDYGIETKAIVITERIEERKLNASSSTGSRIYKVSIPTIQYVINNDTMVSEVDNWASSIDDRVSSSNPLLSIGDEFTITVHPEHTDYFIREGEGDPTNWVGFIIWGGIGLIFLFLFFKSML